ncbi:hypothetical protein B0H16DRAFT_1724893 [Mycena metata]|uniref:Uncharacterized protein n=1 Tax=Mycena metata TaxID=1033252 RepID=A0AAD7ISV4_9AGAR|nr:hypothetical protein B0H16DRAFT_1724893 [Mycena metata]
MTDELWAEIEPTTLHVFHNPADPTSVDTTERIQAAVHMFPRPPTKAPKFQSKNAIRGPLKLDVIVHERAPTAEEFRLILFLHESATGFSSFVNPKAVDKLRAYPTNAEALAKLVERQPDLLIWPVVVDWEHDQVSVGIQCTPVLKKAAERRRKVLQPDEPVEPERPDPQAKEWMNLYD